MRFSVKRTDNDKDMIEEYQLRVLPETAANEQALRRYVAREKGKDERTLTAIRVLKRSIDARQRTIFVNLKLRVYVNEQPEDDEFVRHTGMWRDVRRWLWSVPVPADCLPPCA